MKENKTAPTDLSVADYLNAIPDEPLRQDCLALDQIMREVTGCEACMWGESIVGYGTYHYKYASGRQGDSPLTGFAARKQSLTIYITSGFVLFPDLLAKLGKFTHAKSCLYIKHLSDVNSVVLRELISRSVEHMRETASPQY